MYLSLISSWAWREDILRKRGYQQDSEIIQMLIRFEIQVPLSIIGEGGGGVG